MSKRFHDKYGWKLSGEPPSLITPKSARRSAEKMTLFLKGEGYFNASVQSNVVERRKKKAKVYYTVIARQPYRILQVPTLKVLDSAMAPEVAVAMRKTLIEREAIFSSELLGKERERVVAEMRNMGYYRFSVNDLSFDVDTNLKMHKVKITLVVANPKGLNAHQKYYFRKFLVDANFHFGDSISLDTPEIARQFRVVGDKENPLNQLIYSYVYVNPGEEYNLKLMQQSLRKLRELKQFKYIDLKYGIDTTRSDSQLLDVFIGMTPYDRYRFQTQLELNTSEEQYVRQINPNRLYGLAGSLSFTDINFLGRGIQSEMAISLSAEISSFQWPLSLYNGELGLSNAYYFPRPFLHQVIPDALELSIKSSSFRWQLFRENNPDFRRSTATINLAYFLNQDNFSHAVSPLEFSLVGADLVSEAFKETITSSSNLFLKNLFDNHVIPSSRWKLYFTNKVVDDNKSYWDLQLNLAEFAGNSFYVLSRLIGTESTGEDLATFERNLAGMNFFQYYKGDYDVRFHQKTFFGHEFVYRAYLGLIVPYGNTPNAVPFEKRYYAGGSNGIRGWAIRELGPGGFDDEGDDDLLFLKSGDIKLELNWEYRFELSSTLKMAMFIDAGNVWNHPRNRIDVEGGYFTYNDFYKQLAVAGGVGTRFDFTYFVFRVDLGVPLRSPISRDGANWFPDEYYAPFKFFQTPQLNFGIGYPF